MEHPYKLYSASCRDFNDIVSLYSVNKCAQFLKFRKNMVRVLFLTLKKEDTPWKLDKVHCGQLTNVNKIRVHRSLPFIAFLKDWSHVFFFMEEVHEKQLVKNKELKYVGAYFAKEGGPKIT